MSNFGMADRQCLEKFLGMGSGYVLTFSDRTFGEFVFETVGADIHSAQYTKQGTSKANKLRSFWKQESDYKVGQLLKALVDYEASQNLQPTPEQNALHERCGHIAAH